MEYERSIYRVYSKTITESTSPKICKITYKISFIIGFVALFYVAAGHITYYDGGRCAQLATRIYVQENIDKYMPEDIELPWDKKNPEPKPEPKKEEKSKQKMRILEKFNKNNQISTHKSAQAEPSQFSISPSFSSLSPLYEKSPQPQTFQPQILKNDDQKYQLINRTINRTSLLMQDDQIFFYLITNFSSFETTLPYIPPSKITNFTKPELTFSYSSRPAIQRLTRKPTDYNITIHRIFIDSRCYKKAFLPLSLEPRVILDILNTLPDRNAYLRNENSKEEWFWSAMALHNLVGLRSSGYHLKLLQLVIIALGLVIISFATSLYTKIVTFLSPLILYALIKSFGGRCFLRNIHQLRAVMHNYYRAFPWVGIYLQSLRARQHSRGRSFEFFLIFAIVFMVVIFYFVYLALARLSSDILFMHTMPSGIDENLFGIFAVIELMAVFAFRTRQSLHFAPKFLLMSTFAFLLYVNFTAYGFYWAGLVSLAGMMFGCGGYCLVNFEMPAMKMRDGDFEKPGEYRPRTAFQPFFSLTWYHDLPPFWTIFVPFYDRTHFSSAELSLVDENHALMDSYLRGTFDEDEREIEVEEQGEEEVDEEEVEVIGEELDDTRNNMLENQLI